MTSNAYSRHPLARVLSKAAPDLLELVNWPAMERRSIAFVWILLGGTVLLLAAISISAWMFGDLIGYYFVNVPRFDLLVFVAGLVLALATRMTTATIGRANQELGKYPEIALFGHCAPILYLREFSQENPDLERPEIETTAQTWFGSIGRLVVSTDNSLENLLSKELEGIGPLLCLRDPHKRRKEGGAFRIQAVGQTWQSIVRDLVQHSSFVFMHFGSSASVAWEVEEIIERTSKPLLLWIEYVVVPWDTRQSGGDYIELFPKALVPLMRASSITMADLGPADDDRGFLFLVTQDRRVLWRRPQARWTSLKECIGELKREGQLKTTPNAARRPVIQSGYATSKLLVGIASLALFACIAAVGTKYAQYSIVASRSPLGVASIACRQGDQEMCYALSYEAPLDQTQAFAERACELGHAQACTELGTFLLRRAQTSEARRDALSKVFFACGSRIRVACDAIGDEGGRLLQSESATGVEYLREACLGGSGGSCATLATFYWPNDYINARDYAERACSLREPEGCRLLSEAYRFGLGVPADLQLAESYTTQALQMTEQWQGGLYFRNNSTREPPYAIPNPGWVEEPVRATPSSAGALPEMVPIPGRNFEISRYEVTFGQWDACVAAGGCNGYRPSDEGWGRASRPVILVNWNDAQAYVQWLSQRTGQRYRLPTSGEWEIAARADTMTNFSWGDQDPVCDRSARNGANFEGCNYGTLPVGSFPPNGFGLYDVHGNVWEWVEDAEGSSRVIRGGSWMGNSQVLSSAFHGRSYSDVRQNVVGFRVARTV